MKRICFLSPKAYPLFNYRAGVPFGGTEVQLYLLAKGLSTRSDVRVSFIVADDGQSAKETFGAIDIFKSFRFTDGFIKKAISFYRVLKQVDADVYVQSTLTPFSGGIALLCRLNGKKFVYRVASDSEVDGRYERENGKFIAYISKFVFKFSDLIIVQNAFQKEKIRERKAKNVLMLRSGVSIDSAETVKEDYVLWVGRCVKTKRPELFLQLAKRMPNLKCIMVLSGDAKGDLYQQIKSQAKEIPNLELRESLSFRDTEGCFKKAKVFVSTSDMEGFPMVFLQAAANGIPIVSLYVDPDGILKEKRCGLFSEGKEAVFEKQVKELFEDENLYRQLGNNGLNFVKNECDILSVAGQFYEKVISF